MAARTTLRARIIRELRGHPLPAGTGVLAACCAAGRKRASAITFTELVKLEAAGVVKRLAPVIAGRGRPMFRWILKRSDG